MTTPLPDDASLLLLVAEQAEKIARLEARLDHNETDFGQRLSNAFKIIQGQRSAIQALDGTNEHFDDLERKIAELAARPAPDAEEDTGEYEPQPTARWWDPEFSRRGITDTGEETPSEADERIEEIQDWLDKVFRPGYQQFSHIENTIPPCWPQHPLMLYLLDMIMEIWKALYLTQSRDTRLLASQAQFQSKILPDLRLQFAEAKSACTHPVTLKAPADEQATA